MIHVVFLQNAVAGIFYVFVNLYLYMKGHKDAQKKHPNHDLSDDASDLVNEYKRKNGSNTPF